MYIFDIYEVEPSAVDLKEVFRLRPDPARLVSEILVFGVVGWVLRDELKISSSVLIVLLQT